MNKSILQSVRYTVTKTQWNTNESAK